MQIASFEKRVFAFLIDYLFAVIASGLLYFFVFINLWHLPLLFIFIIGPTLVTFFYVLFVGLFTYFSNGYTLGNLIIGLRMVSIKFHKLSLRQVLVKYFTLSLFPCVLVNVIYMLYKHTEKTIFDDLSHTISISIR